MAGAPGRKTRELLREHGVNESWIESMRPGGDMDWTMIDERLIVFCEGSAIWNTELSRKEAGDLWNAYEFERRPERDDEPNEVFPSGRLSKWAGVLPDPDWQSMVAGYRQAARVLAAACQSYPECTDPYLFICRHVLELQLKSIIATGPENGKVPTNHPLNRLWTSARERVKASGWTGPAEGIERVDKVIAEYNRVDHTSTLFRYPTQKDGSPTAREAFVTSFDLDGQSARFNETADVLDEAAKATWMRNLFRQIAKATVRDR